MELGAARATLAAERAAVARAEAEVASLGQALELLPASLVGDSDECRTRVLARRAVAVGALVSARERAAESAARIAAAESAEATEAAPAAELIEAATAAELIEAAEADNAGDLSGAASARSQLSARATVKPRPALAGDYLCHRERIVATAQKREREALLSNVVTAFARRVDALARRDVVANELARKGEAHTRQLVATRERKRERPLRREPHRSNCHA
jgi:hypothetical protein